MDKVRSCYAACWDNDVVAVRRALEEGFVVDSCDWFNGRTLLHVSAEYGRTEIVSLLLEHKADVNVQDEYGDTPLHVSAGWGHTEIVSLLLEYKADVNVQDKYGDTPLHVSAGYGHTEIVSLLLEHKADVNVQNDKGDTPLHVSAKYGYTEIVSLLLEHKADVNVQDKYVDVPLHVSTRCGCTEIVSLLLEHKADVNVQGKNGDTPLHESAHSGHKEIVSLLLANVDNVNVKDNYGYTPLHYSAGGGHKEIVSMLLSKNADVNVQNKDGMTPLHLSVWHGQTETVSLLLANKANVNVKCDGFTPIDYARNTEVVDVLRQHGAVPDKQGRRPTDLCSIWSQTTATMTSSVKVTLKPGVEDKSDRSASTSFSHARTIQMKDEVTNLIRNDEATSNPARIYENIHQHKILDPQTVSALEHGQVLASATAGDIQQAVTNRLKGFPGTSSSQRSISTDVSTYPQIEATAVNISITSNVNVNNEINIADTRDVKVQNAQIKKACVAYNSSIQVFNNSREHALMMRQKKKKKKKI